jgi:hypothetical protein
MSPFSWILFSVSKLQGGQPVLLRNAREQIATSRQGLNCLSVDFPWKKARENYGEQTGIPVVEAWKWSAKECSGVRHCAFQKVPSGSPRYQRCSLMACSVLAKVGPYSTVPLSPGISPRSISLVEVDWGFRPFLKNSYAFQGSTTSPQVKRSTAA